ncbi:MAG: endonuclease III [Clostridiales bacterium]|jgi:endonuclease-3|nr:endonuclease III [Clostridiales bacterium]
MDERTARIIKKLKDCYGAPDTALRYNNEFELLVAVILSAQCTDERVNKITPAVFKEYGTPEKMARADEENLKKLIYSCGFYNAKAKNLIKASKDIVYKFGGKVPKTQEELMSLSGVGRKTANVLRAVAFGEQAMPVDTHVFRVSHRLGLSDAPTPEKTEMDLVRLIENQQLTISHHLFIVHGRKTCHAKRPKCEDCCVKEFCVFYEQNIVKTETSREYI